MALVQADSDEVSQIIGVEDLRPEQIIQAVHQLEREMLQIRREGEKLPAWLNWTFFLSKSQTKR